ncbi:MAG: NAD(P)H-dependent oxidoreductase [Defluviitaleaceae bacterium]|nr:NAD(P)H-dependent oxidoreductase [Defluviitaleaceae bacterium]
MKLLVISGTPKKDGLSHTLAAGACEAAKAAGAEAEIIQLKGLTVCRMCGDGWGTCLKTHRCAFGDKDNFNTFQEKMGWADGFVFITPVYWGEVSEGMKTFLDRLRRCEGSKQWNQEVGDSYLSGKSSILVASAGGGGGGIISTFAQMERAVSHMGGTMYPYDVFGFYDFIAVNRWNKDYKLEALKCAVTGLVKKFDERAEGN